MKKGLLTAAMVLVAVCLLWEPQLVREGTGQGLAVCAGSILPGLFPFFVWTELWISLGIAGRLSAWAAPVVSRLFRLPGAAASPILLGAIGGYPMGARTAARLVLDGQLSRSDAERTLAFCNNAGPAFVIGIMGSGLFQSTWVGVGLYLIHIGSAVLVGIGKRAKTKRPLPPCLPGQAETGSSRALVSVVANGGQTAILVCAHVVIFSIFTKLAASVLPDHPVSAVVLALMELAGGVEQLRGSGLPMTVLFPVSAFLLGFGGICVLLQSQAVLADAGISWKPMVKGKLMQGFVSAGLAWLAVPLLPQDCPCMTTVLPSSSGIIQNWCLLGLLMMFLLKKSTGKQEEYGV